MNFYTSVNRYGNNILYRGFENGQRIDKKIPYMPTLFTNSDKETGWNNLQNQPVMPKTFDTMRDAKEWAQQYEGVDNYPIYGTTNYVTQYITDRFPNDIKFEREKVNVVSLDIEVHSEDEMANSSAVKVKRCKPDGHKSLLLLEACPAVCRLPGRGKTTR